MESSLIPHTEGVMKHWLCNSWLARAAVESLWQPQSEQSELGNNSELLLSSKQYRVHYELPYKSGIAVSTTCKEYTGVFISSSPHMEQLLHDWVTRSACIHAAIWCRKSCPSLQELNSAFHIIFLCKTVSKLSIFTVENYIKKIDVNQTRTVIK